MFVYISRFPLKTAIEVTEKSKRIPVSLPNSQKLLDIVNKAKEWLSKVWSCVIFFSTLF